MSSRTQQGMPGPDGCPAAAIVNLAHPSAPGAFASHEDANGELTVTALPRALRLLNLPTDHDLAVAAAHRPSMNLVEFNELVAELLEDQEATRRAAISLQSALRGFAARARKKAKKKKSKQPSGDLDAVSMTKYVSGLDVSAVSGQLALLELNAPSLQLHRLSGLHTFPALTSLDVTSCRIGDVGARTVAQKLLQRRRARRTHQADVHGRALQQSRAREDCGITSRAKRVPARRVDETW